MNREKVVYHLGDNHCEENPLPICNKCAVRHEESQLIGMLLTGLDCQKLRALEKEALTTARAAVVRGSSIKGRKVFETIVLYARLQNEKDADYIERLALLPEGDALVEQILINITLRRGENIDPKGRLTRKR